LYGPGAEKLKLDKRTFTTPTKRIVEINLITSNYHIELSPGDAGLNDRFVVQEVVKEMASNRNIISATSMMISSSGSGTTTDAMTTTTSGSSNGNTHRADFKTVVLMDCDQLSRQAQAALRRTMERYATSCRLILCCTSQSKVIEPVRSRCLGIRVAAPTEQEVRSGIFLNENYESFCM
jgi:replication factor C subunit 3/5